LFAEGSLKKAISQAYPELDFTKWKNGKNFVNIFPFLTVYSLRAATKKPNGYWHTNARAFFDSFAQENDMNPLAADSWYSMPTTRILAKQVC